MYVCVHCIRVWMCVLVLVCAQVCVCRVQCALVDQRPLSARICDTQCTCPCVGAGEGLGVQQNVQQAPEQASRRGAVGSVAHLEPILPREAQRIFAHLPSWAAH